MPSTADKVQRYMEGDIVFERALARGTLNLRRAARWLIDQEGWDVTEEAVVSALRRYTRSPVDADVREGYELLHDAPVGMRTGLALVTVSDVGAVRRRARKTIQAEADAPPEAVLPASETVTYLTEEKAAKAVASAVQDARDLVHPVTVVRIGLPREDPATGVALSVLLNTFGQRGIRLLEGFSSGDEFSILVRGQFTSDADDVLLQLRGEE